MQPSVASDDVSESPIRDASPEVVITPRGKLAYSYTFKVTLVPGCNTAEFTLAPDRTTADLTTQSPPSVTTSRPQQPLPLVPDPTFTPREFDVLKLLCECLSDKEIAAKLGLARTTVSGHVGVILQKFGVSSRQGAIVVALRQGIVPFPASEPDGA